MNFHDKTIYVIRKDGHYDIIYKPEDVRKWQELETYDIFYVKPEVDE